MNLPISSEPSNAMWDAAAVVLADSAIKGAVVLIVAAVLARLLRNRSAAVRHLNWLLALTALLLLPAVSMLAPQWGLPVLPASTADVQPASTFMPESATVMPASPRPHVDAPQIHRSIAPPAPQHGLNATSPPLIEPTPAPRLTQPLPAVAWLLVGWAIVALLVLAQLPIGVAVIAWRRRIAARLDDEPWNSLAADLARSLGLRRSVPLLINADSTMPMAAGIFRPAILLPAEARDWPPDKRRVVLLHELAHVRRRDCLTHAVAHAALALHWFNPLAWFAMRRLTPEREMACDDMVLNAAITPADVAASGGGGGLPGAGAEATPPGAGASTYAAHLLEIARTTHTVASTTTSAVAVTMARPSQLEGRLRAILDAARPRNPATGRMLALAIVAAAVLLVPLASVRLSQAQADDEDLYKPIAPEAQHVELTSDITGLVTDESGKPIPEAVVLALRGRLQNGRVPDNASRRTTVTDAQGRFSFSDLNGDDYWSFSADHPQYAWQYQHEHRLRIPAGPESLPIRLTLAEPHTLRGRVVDAEGRGVAGVEIVLTNQKLPGDASYLAGHGYQDGLVATTGEGGRFTIDRLRPGLAEFILKHPDYAMAFASATVDAGGDPSTFTVHRGLTLEGRVVYDGKPVSRVPLEVEVGEEYGLETELEVRTNAQGRFRIEHVPLAPQWFDKDSAPAVQIAIAPTEEKWHSHKYGVFEVDGQLPQVTIEAKARQPGQQPEQQYVGVGKRVGLAQGGEGGTLNVHIPGLNDDRVMIHATLLDDTPWGPSPIEYPKQDRAVFEDLPPGTYRVSIFGGTTMTNRPGYPPKDAKVAAGQTANVTLEPGPLKLAGVVRSGGKPLDRGHIAWFGSPKMPGSVYQGGVEIQPDGHYAIEGLSPGRYLLIHSSYVQDPAQRNPYRRSMSNEFAVEIAQPRTTFDITLPSGRIEGRLIGRTPKPVDPDGFGATSITVIPGSYEITGTSISLEADPQGRFTIDHVPPGVYTIKGYDLFTNVTVPQEGAVVIATLQPPDKKGDIAGLVAGIPASVRSSRDELYAVAFPREAGEGEGYNFVAGTYTLLNKTTGAFRFRDLPVGMYGILVTESGFEPKSLPTMWVANVVVRDGMVRRVEIDTPRGREVEFVPKARLAGGGTNFRLLLPSGHWLDFGGHFPGWKMILPLGDYTVEADFAAGGRTTQTFTVEPGEGAQKVTLKPPD